MPVCAFKSYEVSAGTLAMDTSLIINSYSSYANRMLILFPDVEFNPGPSEDTRLLLTAMNDVKAELQHVLGELTSVKTKLRDMKSEFVSNIMNVKIPEEFQPQTTSAMNGMCERIDSIEYRNEVFESDIRELFLHDEKTRDRLD